MPKHIPWTPNSSRKVEEPFDLMAWVDRHADDLKQTGSIPLFDPSLYQSDVYVHGSGDQGMRFKAKSEHSETIFWVLRGSVCLGKICALKNKDHFIKNPASTRSIITPNNYFFPFTL